MKVVKSRRNIRYYDKNPRSEVLNDLHLHLQTGLYRVWEYGIMYSMSFTAQGCLMRDIGIYKEIEKWYASLDNDLKSQVNCEGERWDIDQMN